MSDEASIRALAVRRRTLRVYNARVHRGDAADGRFTCPAADPVGIARDAPGRTTGREDA